MRVNKFSSKRVSFFSAKKCSITIQNDQFEGLTQKMTKFVWMFQFQSGSTIRKSLSAIKSLPEKYSLIVLASVQSRTQSWNRFNTHTDNSVTNHSKPNYGKEKTFRDCFQENSRKIKDFVILEWKTPFFRLRRTKMKETVKI